MNHSPTTMQSRLLEVLEQAPTDTRALADRFGISCDYVRTRMRELVQLGVVRVVSKKPNGPGNRATLNVWGLAPKERV